VWLVPFHNYFQNYELHRQQDSIDEGSVRRKAVTYIRQHKHRKKKVDIYLCLEWNSNPIGQCDFSYL
jgi:hypothetical protein